jgi:hypothetical protein
MGGFGAIYVPHKRKGKFVFDTAPMTLAVSNESPKKEKGKHLQSLPLATQWLIRDWLNEINVPLGSTTHEGKEEEGVTNHHSYRKIANLHYYQQLLNWINTRPEATCLSSRARARPR